MSWFVDKLENKYSIPINTERDRFTLGLVQEMDDDLEEVSIMDFQEGEKNGSASTTDSESSKR